jgi:hypothetical protein
MSGHPDISCYSAGGDLLTCVLGDIVASLGEPLFGLLIGGTALASIYAAGGRDIATPAVLVILFGGIMIPVLPGQYQTLAGSIMLVGFAAGLFGVAREYFLNPGV